MVADLEWRTYMVADLRWWTYDGGSRVADLVWTWSGRPLSGGWRSLPFPWGR